MPKSSTVYICQNCGESQPKWSGQCPNCGEWNTLVETMKEAPPKKGLRPAAKPYNQDQLVPFSQVGRVITPRHRISTGMKEFDRVLGEDKAGAGMVPGAVMLIGGEPGIGKSTILTQLVIRLLAGNGQAARAQESSAPPATPAKQPKTHKKQSEDNPEGNAPILYVSGEESPAQIALRINRILDNEHIKIDRQKLDELLLFVSSTDVDQITNMIEQQRPSLVIVDSIQTLETEDLMGSSGSVGQLRESTERITTVVKKLHIPTFLVGHVTKEGTIAGPKVLEHIVDTVLELTGERTGQLRLLRAIKNRFGATDEVGVFQVNEYGLEEVTNPSQIFLEHAQKSLPGSATVCVMEGTRPLLVEVQALVVESQLAMPRRVGRGVQLPRIQVLAAVLQKHCRVPLASTDIFLNVAGGFTVTEPAVDLGLALAIVSSFRNKPLPSQSVFIGEVGLLGEIRNVSYLQRRIKEAERLGFANVFSRDRFTSLQQVLKELGLS